LQSGGACQGMYRVDFLLEDFQVHEHCLNQGCIRPSPWREAGSIDRSCLMCRMPNRQDNCLTSEAVKEESNQEILQQCDY
jgi:hypothetical protein